MQKYSLTVTNDSPLFGNICVFQTLPDQPENVVSLAWLNKPAHPGTTVEFHWNTSYNFVWSPQGVLVPGVTFEVSESIDAEPSDITKNSVGFTREYGVYHFTKANRSTPSGKMGIYMDQNVPYGEASVGMGMSGSSTFAMTAMPNYNFSFFPHPQYRVVFGSYEKGEVMDIEALTNMAEIIFEPDNYDMHATLQKDNTWSVSR